MWHFPDFHHRNENRFVDNAHNTRFAWITKWRKKNITCKFDGTRKFAEAKNVHAWFTFFNDIIFPFRIRLRVRFCCLFGYSKKLRLTVILLSSIRINNKTKKKRLTAIGNKNSVIRRKNSISFCRSEGKHRRSKRSKNNDHISLFCQCARRSMASLAFLSIVCPIKATHKIEIERKKRRNRIARINEFSLDSQLLSLDVNFDVVVDDARSRVYWKWTNDKW